MGDHPALVGIGRPDPGIRRPRGAGVGIDANHRTVERQRITGCPEILGAQCSPFSSRQRLQLADSHRGIAATVALRALPVVRLAGEGPVAGAREQRPVRPEGERGDRVRRPLLTPVLDQRHPTDHAVAGELQSHQSTTDDALAGSGRCRAVLVAGSHRSVGRRRSSNGGVVGIERVQVRASGVGGVELDGEQPAAIGGVHLGGEVDQDRGIGIVDVVEHLDRAALLSHEHVTIGANSSEVGRSSPDTTSRSSKPGTKACDVVAGRVITDAQTSASDITMIARAFIPPPFRHCQLGRRRRSRQASVRQVNGRTALCALACALDANKTGSDGAEHPRPGERVLEQAGDRHRAGAARHRGDRPGDRLARCRSRRRRRCPPPTVTPRRRRPPRRA